MLFTQCFTIADIYSNKANDSSWDLPAEMFAPASTFVHAKDPYDMGGSWDLTYTVKYNPSSGFQHSKDSITPIPGDAGDAGSIFNKF